MATSPAAAAGHPHLSPQFCFSTGALKEFLRLSRTVDDTISQSLNTLSTPSRTPFDPTLTARLSPHRLPASACTQFTQRVLFPSWQARTAVLEYCGRVAQAEDPMDPVEVAAAAAEERVVDERLDPYSARYYPKERRTEVLAAVVGGECGVEEIVRERSWRVVGERCEGVGQREGRGWRAAFEEWGAGRG